MLKKIVHNWKWKLLSVAISFLVWLLVMNYEDPYIQKPFRGVTVVKVNEEMITAQRKAVEYRSGETVDLVLRGKRSVMDRLTTDSIYVYADLSAVSFTNSVDIRVEVNETVEIVSQEPSKMQISLENIVTVQKEVQDFYDGELAENYIKLGPTITPSMIQITGPESKVALVSRVFVPIKIEGASEDVSVFAAPQLVDENNREIRGLTISNSLVEVKVPVQRVKTVSIIESIPRKVPEGYELISLNLGFDRVKVRGKDDNLNALRQILVNNIDISTYTESTTLSIILTDYLPNDVYLYDTPEELTIDIVIAPIVQTEVEVLSENIEIRQVPENMTVSVLTDEPLTFRFQGIQSRLDTITPESLKPYISLDNLNAGVHDIEVEFTNPIMTKAIHETLLLKIVLVEEVNDETEGEDIPTGDN